jgi:transposase
MAAILNTLRLMVMAIEISAAKWIVASTESGARKVRRKTLDEEQVGERFEAFLGEIEVARGHLHVWASARLLVAYEAGQEGFWLVRALRARGIDAEVIDPVSLQVDRRARRVKTDRVDAQALVAALYRYASGEVQALRMVRVPSIEAEASREWPRERDRLEGERRGCTDRIMKKLRTQGIWSVPKTWSADLRNDVLRTFEGEALSPMLIFVTRSQQPKRAGQAPHLQEQEHRGGTPLPQQQHCGQAETKKTSPPSARPNDAPAQSDKYTETPRRPQRTRSPVRAGSCRVSVRSSRARYTPPTGSLWQ